MQPHLTVGFFDHPLVVAAFLIAGALIHWLSQRRLQQEQEQQQREAEAAPSPEPPPAQSELEERLRELLGGAPPRSAPPPVPDAPPLRSETPTRSPSTLWKEAEAAAQTTASQDSAPARARERRLPSPPQVKVRRVASAPWASRQSPEAAAIRLQRRNGQSRDHDWAAGLQLRRRRRAGALTVRWRERESARRAFVASLVFGPPKSLEEPD